MKKFLSGIFLTFLFVGLTAPVFAQEYGMASYYSDDYHGRKTAYGDVYNKSEKTAAHKKHPYGTILKVTRLDNKKSVTVKVTDKGPYIKGRVVELSRRAAEQIGLIKDGLAEVKVEVVKRMERDTEPAKSVSTSSSKKSSSSDDPESYQKKSETKKPVKTSTEKVASRSSSSSKSKETSKGSSSSKSKSAKSKSSSSKAKLVTKNYTQYGLYQIELRKPEKKGFGVQVASLSSYENVLKQVADLQGKWFDNILISVERGSSKPVYKIILGPLENEKAAINYKSSLKKKHKISGFVVDLEEIDY